MLHEAMSLRDIDLLEEQLVIEHSKRRKAEEVLRRIADSPSNRTAWDLRDMASEYLEAA